MASDRPSEAAFVGVSALLFAGSTTLTIIWCASMSAMGMSMPGGWTMSMAWMRMPDQTWLGAATSFLGMWVVMMVAMMLPSLVPMLRRYRQAVGRTGATRLGPLTAIAGLGYLFVWTVFGLAVFPLAVALAEVEMHQPALARAVPSGVGVVVLIAGALQFSAWKARHLACCREAPGAAVRCRPTPPRLGDTACASDFTAATAIARPVSQMVTGSSVACISGRLGGFSETRRSEMSSSFSRWNSIRHASGRVDLLSGSNRQGHQSSPRRPDSIVKRRDGRHPCLRDYAGPISSARSNRQELL